MTTVITYGTFDLFHHGHYELLRRARGLGDRLIVGVTASDFDRKRGKINVKRSLIERVEAVKQTGFADLVIVEEYEGQKIDDVLKYNVDIFTVGSDWEGVFDYLSEYCRVVYLDRTAGISSTALRSQEKPISFGLVGDNSLVFKHVNEIRHINGIDVKGIYTQNKACIQEANESKINAYDNLEELYSEIDAAYVASHPSVRNKHISMALMSNTHVISESPLASSVAEYNKLKELARQHKLVLFDGLKTAYATAYHRLGLLVRSGHIGSVVSVQSTCTSLRKISVDVAATEASSFYAWGPVSLLPIFQLLGTDYEDIRISSRHILGHPDFDVFSKIDIFYANAVASAMVGKGIKSEGQLIVAGTGGYAYVPAPWWKTEYFEIRHENASNNRRYYFNLEGEGIRDMLVDFKNAIESGRESTYVSDSISRAIVKSFEVYNSDKRRNLTPFDISVWAG